MPSSWGNSWGSSWGNSWGDLAAAVVKAAIRSFRVAVSSTVANVSLRKSGAETQVSQITLTEVAERRSRIATAKTVSHIATTINTAE